MFLVNNISNDMRHITIFIITERKRLKLYWCSKDYDFATVEATDDI